MFMSVQGGGALLASLSSAYSGPVGIVEIMFMCVCVRLCMVIHVRTYKLCLCPTPGATPGGRLIPLTRNPPTPPTSTCLPMSLADPWDSPGGSKRVPVVDHLFHRCGKVPFRIHWGTDLASIPDPFGCQNRLKFGQNGFSKQV